MLNRDRKYLITAYMLVFYCFIGCNINSGKQKNRNQQIYDTSVGVLGKGNYNKLKSLIQDSIDSWETNELGNWSIDDSAYSYQLDSLLCFNTSKTKLVSAILTQSKLQDNLCGGLLFFYGEKINERWYFWTGASVFIPQEMNKNLKAKKPISFSQLHEQALKEVFGGYLTKDGQINEEWFVHHFEKAGRFSFEDRYKYKWILDGERINDYDEWYKYTRKRTGLGLWIGKMTRDSINRVNQTLKPDHITREEENEISMYFSRKLVNGK